jgi:hypothetical protein
MVRDVMFYGFNIVQQDGSLGILGPVEPLLEVNSQGVIGKAFYVTHSSDAC